MGLRIEEGLLKNFLLSFQFSPGAAVVDIDPAATVKQPFSGAAARCAQVTASG